MPSGCVHKRLGSALGGCRVISLEFESHSILLGCRRPLIFRDAEQENVAILVDGKGFMVDDPKKNSAMERAYWSDKVHHVAARTIT